MSKATALAHPDTVKDPETGKYDHNKLRAVIRQIKSDIEAGHIEIEHIDYYCSTDGKRVAIWVMQEK